MIFTLGSGMFRGQRVDFCYSQSEHKVESDIPLWYSNTMHLTSLLLFVSFQLWKDLVFREAKLLESLSSQSIPPTK